MDTEKETEEPAEKLAEGTGTFEAPGPWNYEINEDGQLLLYDGNGRTLGQLYDAGGEPEARKIVECVNRTRRFFDRISTAEPPGAVRCDVEAILRCMAELHRINPKVTFPVRDQLNWIECHAEHATSFHPRNCDMLGGEKARLAFLRNEWLVNSEPGIYPIDEWPRDMLLAYVKWLEKPYTEPKEDE
jgi:hypothetical protein